MAIETLHMSRLWLAPQSTGLLQKCQAVVFDICQFGQSCRMRTRVVYANADLQPLARLRSGPRGSYSQTGGPHGQLQGKNSEVVFKTLLAEAYPTKLRKVIVQCFQFALAEMEARSLRDVRCG